MRFGKLLIQDSRQKAYDIELFSLFKQMKEKYMNFEARAFSKDCNNSEFFDIGQKNILATLENEGVDINSICEDEFYIVPVISKCYVQLLCYKLLIVEQYEIALTLEYLKAKYFKSKPKSKFHILINSLVKEYVKCYCFPNETIRLDKISDWVLREQTNSEPIPIIENWEDMKQMSLKDDLTEEEQIKFDKLKSYELKGEEINFIGKDTKPEQFKAFLLQVDNFAERFKPIKWVLLSRLNKPHKSALRDFLTILFGKAPQKKTINVYICDIDGNTIELNKPKNEENAYYYNRLIEILK